jgi:hypothetical protein
MSDDMGDETAVEKSANATISEYLRMAELGLEAAKFVMERSVNSINSAAKTLWISNAGGLVVIIGILTRAETVNTYASAALALSAAIFVLGVYLGTMPHVHAAHNIASYLVSLASILQRLQNGEIKFKDLREETNNLLPDLRGSFLVLTDFLMWAKLCLAIGSSLGVVGLFLMLTLN